MIFHSRIPSLQVLLYNFFADSTASLAQWRVVLNGIEKSKQDPWHPPPQFDNIYHASICNEVSISANRRLALN